jgi:hypothetical protein
MRRVLLASLSLLLLLPAQAATVYVEAARDTTLLEDPDGALANGAGSYVFAGRNNAQVCGVRRGLFFFDLQKVFAEPGPAAVLEIEKVAVILTNLTESNVSPREYRLHRVMADWGEGASWSGGGAGAPSAPADATWIHAFHADTFWLHNGGQFEGGPSARLVVAGPGSYRFEGDDLLRDVKLWMQEPGRGFGWILLGDETTRQTVRAFASREFPDANLRPILEITYTVRKLTRLPYSMK